VRGLRRRLFFLRPLPPRSSWPEQVLFVRLSLFSSLAGAALASGSHFQFRELLHSLFSSEVVPTYSGVYTAKESGSLDFQCHLEGLPSHPLLGLPFGRER
jgi:hypothetical protein